jgi:hypothetical protein
MRRYLVKESSEMYGSVEKSGMTLPSNTDATVVKSRKGSTIASGVVNLSNTIVGAGMLGLPGAFGGTGWLSGTILIVLSASFSAHGLVLLSKAACLTGRPSSFYSLALASVPRYTILIDAAVALKCFGVATGVMCLNCSRFLQLAIDERYSYNIFLRRRLSYNHIRQHG